MTTPQQTDRQRRTRRVALVVVGAMVASLAIPAITLAFL